MDSFDIKKYLDMARRRIYWIIIPFLIVFLSGFYYILKTPKIYEAKTIILVQSQKVPENYVKSTVTTSVQDRLRTITQQVISRTNLENIIQEYQLFDQKPEKDLVMEEKVGLLKNQIIITIATQNASSEGTFSIAFHGSDPQKATQVANSLASNFISENLKIRESQAFGTSDFLSDELESVRKKLMEKEQLLKDFKAKYMGGLPEELDSNLKILDRLQLNLDQLNSKLKTAEEKSLALQQSTALEGQTDISASGPISPSQSEGGDKLLTLKNELTSLQAKYTDNHPDIIQLKSKIAALEESQSKPINPTIGDAAGGITEQQTLLGQTGISKGVSSQRTVIQNDILRLRSQITETETQIGWYQTKIKDTPTRAQEMLSLNRDYGNLNSLYNTMLNRELESEISLNLEKKQQGEQFKIIDSARVPVKPIKPDVQKLSLMILALGLGIGCGLAYMIEFMDTSLRSPGEIETEFNLPVLVTLPTIFTQTEIIKNKKKQIFAVASICVGFILCVFGVAVAAKGAQVSINYLKEILGKMI
jgi:polysaccharide chain length determinant protein (PEP-CTERM system associated)